MEHAPLRVQWAGDHIRFRDQEDIPEEPDMGYMGLNERLVSGLEERAMEDGGDKKGPFFRELIYGSQEYRRAMGSTKMGARQCNWRDASGEFISPIFGIMWRTYAKLLKRDQALRQRKKVVQIQDSAADIGAAISDLTEALGSMNVAVSSMVTKKVEEVERKSSVRGVSYHKPLKKWLVRIMKDRHSYHGGFYESKKEAEKVASVMRNMLYT